MSFLRIKLPGTLDPGVDRPILLEPWSPTELSTSLLAWFDPSSGADGATVTSWTDQSSYHRNAGIVTGVPTYDHDGLDGTPAVLFPGSAYIKTAAFTAVGGAFTVLVNGKATASPATQYFVDGGGSNNMGVYRSPASDVYGMRRTGAGAAVTKGPSDALAHSFIAVFNGLNSKLYVDNMTAPGAGEQGTVSPSAISLGTNGGSSATLTGALGDVVWAAGALDATTCARAMAWLRARRGA